MRRRIKNKHELKPESTYDSVKVAKLVNYIMDSGKKSIARKIVYDCFESIKEKTKTEIPLEVFELALKNTMPAMEVRSRRVGGSNYQVPREVRPERQRALSMKWIVLAARSKKRSEEHTSELQSHH